jgi:hypothetical protein
MNEKVVRVETNGNRLEIAFGLFLFSDDFTGFNILYRRMASFKEKPKVGRDASVPIPREALLRNFEHCTQPMCWVRVETDQRLVYRCNNALTEQKGRVRMIFIVLVPLGIALFAMLGVLIVTGIREGYFRQAR